jgi:DNA-binding MarR family transcriptional regulator
MTSRRKSHEETASAAPKETFVDHQTVEPSIGEALARAAALTNQIFSDCVGDAYGLCRVEFVLLQLITNHPGINQKGLAAAVCVAAPRVSLVLDRMLAKGLVERLPSSRDGRHRCIQLTRQGRALAAQTSKRLLHGEELALSSFSTAERSFLREILLRIAQIRTEPQAVPWLPSESSPTGI